MSCCSPQTTAALTHNRIFQARQLDLSVHVVHQTLSKSSMVDMATTRDCIPYADEVENSNPLLLAMAEQSMEKRQRRISSLLEALPNNLKAAEAAEAVAAAAAKAKQMELPSPENVGPVGSAIRMSPDS